MSSRFVMPFADVGDGINPADGAKLQFYAAGTSTPKDTYSDEDLTTANANPVVADADGVFGDIWMNDGDRYKVVLYDKNDVQQWESDPVIGGLLSGASGLIYETVADMKAASPLVGQSARTLGYYAAGDGGQGEYLIAASASVDGYSDHTLANGNIALIQLKSLSNVCQFGAVGDGITDDAVAINAAHASGAKMVYYPATSASYYITAAIIPAANQVVYGDGAGSVIKLIDGSINGFHGVSIDNVVIRDLAITTASLTNSAAARGGVLVDSGDYWTIKNLSMSSMGYSGVYLLNSNYCLVENNKFSNFFGSIQDAADINLQQNCNHNTIRDNYCFGGSGGVVDHGIMLQDVTAVNTPAGNQILNNTVGAHHAYGIVCYYSLAFDTKLLVDGNKISGISGTGATGAGTFGSGIYMQSAGGSIVTNNTVDNCAIDTTNHDTNAVAHISITGGVFAVDQAFETIVSNNHIVAPRGVCIAVATMQSPVLVSENSIRSTGVSAVRGEAISANTVDNLRIQNNIINHVNANYFAVSALSTTAATARINLDISGNKIKCAAGGIQVSRTSTGTWKWVSIGNNVVYGGSGQALAVLHAEGVLVTGNRLESTNIAGIFTGVTDLRCSNTTFNTSYTPYGLVFTGGCSNGVVDETCILPDRTENDGGVIITQFGNAPGSSGNIWAVGDRKIQSVPVVGSPKGWRCTVAGNPGTWVSAGNL